MPPRNPYANTAAARGNALVRQAMDTLQQIDREAHEKKLAQLEQLKTAKAAILERVKEFSHQLAQIDQAMETIMGPGAPARDQRGRRDLKAVRERVVPWMEGHKGQKFNPADLVREFPELEGSSISMFLKPLVATGKVHTDASDGPKRLKYFVPEG